MQLNVTPHHQAILWSSIVTCINIRTEVYNREVGNNAHKENLNLKKFKYFHLCSM